MFYKRFLHFTGYSSRREFWWTIAMTALLWSALVVLLFTVFINFGILGAIVFAVLSVLLGLSSLSLLFRRYADAGVNRWLAFIFAVAYAVAMPIFGEIFSTIIAFVGVIVIPALPTSKMVKRVVTVYSADSE